MVKVKVGMDAFDSNERVNGQASVKILMSYSVSTYWHAVETVLYTWKTGQAIILVSSEVTRRRSFA